MDKRIDTFSLKLPDNLLNRYRNLSDNQRDEARLKMIRTLAEHIDEAEKEKRIKEMLGE